MAMNMDAMLRIKADVQGENNIRRLGNSMQGLQGQAKNAALGFNSLKGAVAGFGAAIAGSALVAGLSAVVKKSIDAGDELFNLQAKTGVAANALIGIGNAAKLADVDVGTLGKGLTKLNVNLVKAAEGNDDLARKFQALGVNVKDANGQVVPADKALKQIADRFADMPDGAQKAAAAVALFGKSGADLIPLLNEGAASMEKFSYKVGEDFAARSDLFNDTITEFGIKTQGFGLELTDALLPALQSILEVFGDLFNTEQDWSSLFDVIKLGIRLVASAIFVTIRLIDVLIKNAVAAFQAISKALQGDFAGAGEIFANRISNFVEQAKSDYNQLQKIFTDAPSPGTGRRTQGRTLELDTSSADAKEAAAAKRRAAEAKRAATEQQRLLEQRASLTQKAISLQEQLRNSIADVTAAYAGIGATPTDQLLLDRNEAIRENNRTIKELTYNVIELEREVNKAGGSLDVKPFADLIDRLSAANVALADKEYQQGFSDYWLSQADAIKEATAAAWEFARAQQYNADIIGGLRDGIGSYVESVGTMREATAQLAQTGIKGVEDAIFSLMTTGTANFKQFAAEILKQTARMIIQQLILKTIMQVLGAIGGGGGGGLGGIGASTQFNASGVNFNPAAFSGPKLFADGGIMTGDGPVPLKKYASGGIANSPQLALYGEGSRPEAYVPLPDGRRIPVAMQGGGGGGNTSVVVNVDASGSQVQGDAGKGEQLGRVISQAVQAELIRQKRPGGLLMA
jgi:lambda family phage tail tape measure protein